VSGGPQSGAVDAYDPATNSWSSRAPLPTPRAYHAAALGADGLIYVVGGIGAGANVEAYDPGTDTWRTVAPLPTPRYGLAAASSGGAVYAIGGQESIVAQNKVEALVLAGGSVAPASLNFGNQEAGTPSPAQDVTLSSDGTLPLRVTAVSITGGGAGDFAVTFDGCTGRLIAAGGSCAVSVTFTPTAAGARSATLAVGTSSAAGTHTVALAGTGVITDSTPPTLHLPGDIVVDAVGPAGTTVSYSVTATDAESTVASIACSPASGTLFAIGTTTVSCTATDSRGNTSAPATFNITVQGGSAQLGDLLADVQGVGPGKSLAAKVEAAQAALAAGDTVGACAALDSFLAEVRAQSGKKITVPQAQALAADANRIKAVIGC
jgi:hypothetical protein